MAPTNKGPLLPASLVEELGLDPAAVGRRQQSQPERPPRGKSFGASSKQHQQPPYKKSGPLGRKDARKAAREAKKRAPSSSVNRPAAAAGGRSAGLKVIGKTKSAQQQRPPRPAEQPKLVPKAAAAPAEKTSVKGKQKAKELSRAPVESHEAAAPPKKRKRENEAPSSAPASSKKASKSDNLSRKDDAEASSSSAPAGQKRKVSSTTMTPLQRLLAKTGGAGGDAAGGASADTSGSKARRGKSGKRRSEMTQAERDEEDEIAWLEAKLGGASKGKQPKAQSAKGKGKAVEEDDAGDEEDGLDDLLGHLDNFYTGMYDNGAGEAEDAGSEEDSDLDDEPDEDIDLDDSEDEEAASEEDSEDDVESDEASLLSGEDSVDEDASPSIDDSQTEPDEAGDEEMDTEAEEDEDESDRKAEEASPAEVDAPSLPTDKYIPPALRRAAAAATSASSTAQTSPAFDEAALTGLRRQLKGLLNRMGEGNVETIIVQLEEIYRANSRAIVSQTLTKLVLETIVASKNLADTFVVLYAALVTGLHRVIGVEFAAAFLQSLIDDLLAAYEEAEARGVNPQEEEDTSSPRALNLVSLVCELYNLQSISAPLLYDLIRHFAKPSATQSKGVSELSVELLLRIVKLSGQQLRHDDSSSLRDIVDFVQSSVQPAGSQTILSARSRFMLETLNDLKAGKGLAKKNAAAANSSAAHASLERMKKMIGGLGKKRTLRAHDSLRVTLRDLRDADRKGKWWLVGAAWTGHTDKEQEEATGVTAARPLAKRKSAAQEGESNKTQEKLLAYARRHGMNTEARRNIFVTIMTSEDFVDASQKLLQLKLTEVQRREIVRVLLQCLDIDEAYNPFFALIGQQLAVDSHSAKFTMQYALWDFMRSIGETSVAGRSKTDLAEDTYDEFDDERAVSDKKLAHVARAYAWWIAQDVLSFNVLKSVDFTTLKSRGTLFLQLLLANTLLYTQSSSPTLDAFPKFVESSADRKALEDCLVRGTAGNVDLARGLLFFTRKELQEQQLTRIMGKNAPKPVARCLKWAVGFMSKFFESAAM